MVSEGDSGSLGQQLGLEGFLGFSLLPDVVGGGLEQETQGHSGQHNQTTEHESIFKTQYQGLAGNALTGGEGDPGLRQGHEAGFMAEYKQHGP